MMSEEGDVLFKFCTVRLPTYTVALRWVPCSRVISQTKLKKPAAPLIADQFPKKYGRHHSKASISQKEEGSVGVEIN